MSQSRRPRRPAPTRAGWVIITVIAAAWMWGAAVGLRTFGAEALARAEWIGDPGTVVVDDCGDGAISIGIDARQADCHGRFTSTGGTTTPGVVAIANAGEIESGGSVEVRRVGEVAYEPDGGYAVLAAIVTLLCGTLGGLPIVALVRTIRARRARPSTPAVRQRRRPRRRRGGRSRVRSRGGRPR